MTTRSDMRRVGRSSRGTRRTRDADRRVQPVQRVVRALLRRQLLHPRVLDPQLLAQERDLASGPVVLGLESGAGVELVFGAAPARNNIGV